MEMDKEYERKCFELAYLIFPDVNETVDDLEIRYPARNLKEGAKVVRIGPSPTGMMHTGTLFQAMVNRKLASQSEGVFYVRVEDTDQKREVEGAVQEIIDGLEHFDLMPDEGVIGKDKEKGDYGPYTQSKRAEIYRICAKHLIEIGRAYPCFCTPEMLQKTHDQQVANKIIPGYYGVYAKCRNRSIDEAIERVKAGEKFILRFRSNGSHLNKIAFVDDARGKIEMADNDEDIVLIKSDGLPTYHFAHICDDHFMHTTHVVRAEEWLPSVPKHLQLFEAMGFEAPHYIHTPTIMIKDGDSKRKLSKRKDKVAAVSYFISAGYPVEGLNDYLMTILNSDFEMWKSQNKDKSYKDFTFKLDKMSSAGSLLDIPKLNDLSKEAIARMTGDEVLKCVLEWSKEFNKDFYDLLNKDLKYAREVFGLERDNATKIRKDIFKWEDVEPTFRYFFDENYKNELETEGYIIKTLTEEKATLTPEVMVKALEAYKTAYNEADDKDTWFARMKEVAEGLNFCTNMKEYKANPDAYVGSIADFSSIVRMAVTNRKNTPDIYSIMQLLGKDRTIARMEDTIEKLK
jgi:glutamyl-tRNA synthetase